MDAQTEGQEWRRAVVRRNLDEYRLSEKDERSDPPAPSEEISSISPQSMCCIMHNFRLILINSAFIEFDKVRFGIKKWRTYRSEVFDQRPQRETIKRKFRMRFENVPTHRRLTKKVCRDVTSA